MGDQIQLILTTCSVRYHIALWYNRSMGQLSERFLKCLVVSGLHQLAMAWTPPPQKNALPRRRILVALDVCLSVYNLCQPAEAALAAANIGKDVYHTGARVFPACTWSDWRHGEGLTEENCGMHHVTLGER